MSRYEDRVKGNVVHLLDEVSALALIRNKLGNENAEVTAEEMVVVNGKNGLATVITEGVGWWADKDGGIPINFRSGSYGQGGYVDVTEEELRGVISNKTIDLADFVRVFGDRLENNFYGWVGYARGYDQSMSVVSDTMELA
jgi:hypothetical protein